LQDQVQDLLVQVDRFNEVQQDNEQLVQQIDLVYAELKIAKEQRATDLNELESQKTHEILMLKDQIKYLV
jgi:hypothetical protein